MKALLSATLILACLLSVARGQDHGLNTNTPSTRAADTNSTTPEAASSGIKTNMELKILTGTNSLLKQVVEFRNPNRTKPARFDSWPQRLNYVQSNLTYYLQGQTIQVDSYFAHQLEHPETLEHSRFRLNVFAEMYQDGGFKFKISPDFDADLKLPNVEKRLKLIVETDNNANLPGTDPVDQDQSVHVGLRQYFKNWRYDLGVRVKWPPKAYTRLDWKPKFRLGPWHASFRQRFYYDTDKGFGEVSSYHMARWLNTAKTLGTSYSCAGKWTEESSGYEWEQMIILAIVRDVIEQKNKGKSVSSEDVARGLSGRYRMTGHDNGPAVIDSHEVRLTHRRPLLPRHNWLFMELIVGLEWTDDRDWNTDPFFKIGFDALFWNTSGIIN